MVLIGAIKVLGSAKINADGTEKRIQAVSLAREGLELVRYIRNLNYMKHSSNKRVCWNFLSDNGGIENYPHGSDGIVNFADGSDKTCLEQGGLNGIANFYLSEGEYYVPIQNLNDESNGRFFLSNFGEDLTTAWGKQNNGGIFKDLSRFRLCKDLDSGLIISCESAGLINKKELGFFRGIKIEYVDIFGQSYDVLGQGMKGANHMKITSTILWVAGGGLQSVDLVTILSDSEDRNERDT